MRTKIALLLLTSFFSTQLFAQSVFYGLTYGDGTDFNVNRYGTIIKFDPATNNLTAPYSFKNYGTAPFYAEMIQGNNGKLYGQTQMGGVLFSYDLSTKTYTKETAIFGSFSTGVLTKGNGSMIYGTMEGNIFSYNTGTGSLTIRHNFTGGDYTQAGLTGAADGKFYGTTGNAIYSFDTVTNTFTKVFNLNSTTGTLPNGLILGADNLLYGLTTNYTIASFNPSTLAFTTLHSIGIAPQSFLRREERLTLGTDGKLYGVTSQGGTGTRGFIFSYNPTTDIFTNLHNNSDGIFTTALTQNSDGKLYGTTAGSDFRAVLFSIDPSGVFTPIHKFINYNDGEIPTGRMLLASDGRLYGATVSTFDYVDQGTIFSYDRSSNEFHEVFDFGGPYGRKPYNSLVKGSGDVLFGMTSAGGYLDQGVIFSFNTATGVYTKRFDFDTATGNFPRGNLTPGPNGKFYGMTYQGGSFNRGVLFSFDTSTNSYIKLHDFNGTDGGNPEGSLFLENGKFYGMTTQGGTNALGVIFIFDPLANTYTKHFDFSTNDGANPHGSFVKGPGGKLYALATSGGVNAFGTIFSFDLSTNGFSKLHDFVSPEGTLPHGDLLFASNGKFFGMTWDGAAYDNGSIFSFDPNTNAVVNLHDFGAAGGGSRGSLVQDDDGKLYGMVAESENVYRGSIFSFDPLTNTYTRLQDFNGDNGAYPIYGALLKVGTGTSPVTSKQVKVNIYGGSNAYNNVEWNNWNTTASLSSGAFKYSDGTISSISATLSQQTAVADNGVPYNSTMAPPEVVRYASYSTSNRTLTISGLNNSKTYDLEIYASRKGVSNNTSRFTIGATAIDIVTDNNLANKASFNNLIPGSGQIVVNISRLNTYNYINGFILTEISTTELNPPPVVDAGDDETITLPDNSVQLNGSASDNGSVSTYNWQKIAGPAQFSFSNASDPHATVSNLVEGNYVFRLTATDNQGASSFDDVSIVVNPAPTKFVKVNVYGGINPYNNPEWNNWNTSASLSSGALRYSDGTLSTITAVLSQQTAISDNGVPYNSTMAPVEVIRYASYSTSNRMLTISGLDNSKTYNLEIYASRKGVSNNTSRFTIESTVIDIVTDNNLSNKASFVSLTPVGGQVTVSIARLNAYNYLNGFVLTENPTATTVPAAITNTGLLPDTEIKPSSAGIFPNPVKNSFTLTINNQYTGQMKIQVIDINGIVQKQFTVVKTKKGLMQTSFFIGELKQGSYIIRTQIGEWSESKKISKL